ncbi:MAG: LysM peptidoglycan-binding domain-containing protein [Chloroflexota bacterium]|nr:LysM peptidoglycan-binding domain-containing protein [Chloroflexota bacterium]
MTDARRELIFGALGLAILAVVAVVLVTQASDSFPGFGDENPTDAVSPGATVPPLPSPTPTPTRAPTPTPTPLPQTYTVQSGDTLALIAERFNVTIEDLAAKNGILDPNNIFAGQKLELPQPDERVTPAVPTGSDDEVYVVKAGDTLFAIAQELGVTVEDLADINDIADPSQLFVGRPLQIPERQTTPPTPRPSP